MMMMIVMFRRLIRVIRVRFVSCQRNDREAPSFIFDRLCCVCVLYVPVLVLTLH